MKTIGRTGFVRTAVLSLLLAAGCSDEQTDPPDSSMDVGDTSGRTESDRIPKSEAAAGVKAEKRRAEAERHQAEAAEMLNAGVITTLSVGTGVTMKLVLVPAGTFTMGSPETETGRNKDEGAQRRVTLTKPFYMGATEVTQAQFQAVMNTQPWKDETDTTADNAASHICWEDATAFCAALSKKSGRTVRLPTEAEWEYACRAGTTTVYSFGDDSSKLGDYAWYRSNSYDKGELFAHQVGVKKPNPWGLYDMHGNVHEWCADLYAASYANADARDPKGPAEGILRVLRGGASDGNPLKCRAAGRLGLIPAFRLFSFGFRVVIEVE